MTMARYSRGRDEIRISSARNRLRGVQVCEVEGAALCATHSQLIENLFRQTARVKKDEVSADLPPRPWNAIESVRAGAPIRIIYSAETPVAAAAACCIAAILGSLRQQLTSNKKKCEAMFLT